MCKIYCFTPRQDDILRGESRKLRWGRGGGAVTLWKILVRGWAVGEGGHPGPAIV